MQMFKIETSSKLKLHYHIDSMHNSLENHIKKYINIILMVDMMPILRKSLLDFFCLYMQKQLSKWAHKKHHRKSQQILNDLYFKNNLYPLFSDTFLFIRTQYRLSQNLHLLPLPLYKNLLFSAIEIKDITCPQNISNIINPEFPEYIKNLKSKPFIYVLWYIHNPKICYIGRTKNLLIRLRAHFNSNSQNRHPKLYNFIQKY